MEPWQIQAGWLAFSCTYLALAIGYVPWFRLDRTGAAFVGAVTMIACGVLTPEQAFLAQDYETLVLLFSMMIIVSFLMNSGIIARLQGQLVSHIQQPVAFLWTVIALSGTMSALFINDIVCLMLTPMVIRCCRALRLQPVPYLLAVAMASNLGSAMTPVGNPQNIFLASLGKVSYATFVQALAPVSLMGLLLLGLVLQWAYGGQLRATETSSFKPAEDGAEPGPPPAALARYVLLRTLAVLVGILIGFWSGWHLGTVASAGAAFLMVTRRISRQRLFALIDWDLLVLFVSLFVLTSGARAAGILPWCYGHLAGLGPEHGLSLSAITLVLSNLFSNVPAVFFLSQFLSQLPRPQESALLVAMVSTLAGNLTLLGSIANLIVAEKAAPEVRLDFWTYTRVGLPVTLLTLATGLAYWHWRFGL